MCCSSDPVQSHKERNIKKFFTSLATKGSPVIIIAFNASQVAPVVKNHLQCRRGGFDPWAGKTPWRRKWQPTPVFLPGESKDRGPWRAAVHGVAERKCVVGEGQLLA